MKGERRRKIKWAAQLSLKPQNNELSIMCTLYSFETGSNYGQYFNKLAVLPNGSLPKQITNLNPLHAIS